MFFWKVYFYSINLYALIIFGSDKAYSKYFRYRISELMLLLPAALGGGIGGLLGIVIFRHKTKKPSFLVKYMVAVLFSYFLLNPIVRLTSS